MRIDSEDHQGDRDDGTQMSHEKFLNTVSESGAIKWDFIQMCNDPELAE